MMKEIKVENKYNGKKLNKIILEKIPQLNYNSFNKLLRKKDIKVNNKRINKDIIIYEGDIINIYMQESMQENIVQKEIKIIFEDENILIVDKPYNLEVTGENSLTQILQQKYNSPEIMPCHRIDRNTTGLVLFAKNKEALEILLKKFKNHEIEKHYIAWVYGIPKRKSARLEDYLFKDTKKSQVYISNIFKKGYQKIITIYKVLEERADNTSILEIEIETGKTHQIRAHLAYIRYPIIGDGKYGRNEINKKFNKKYQQLHSYKLKFKFTTTSGILEYLNGKEIKDVKNINQIFKYDKK